MHWYAIYSPPSIAKGGLEGGHTSCLGHCVPSDTLAALAGGGYVGGVPKGVSLVKGVCVMARFKVNKKRSAGKFRKQRRRTKGANLARPSRGGYRM